LDYCQKITKKYVSNSDNDSVVSSNDSYSTSSQSDFDDEDDCYDTLIKTTKKAVISAIKKRPAEDNRIKIKQLLHSMGTKNISDDIRIMKETHKLIKNIK